MIVFSPAALAADIRVGWLASPSGGEGLDGLRLALADDTVSGRFIGQTYSLEQRQITAGEDPAAALKSFADRGIRFVVVDLPAADLLRAADAAQAQTLVLLDAGSSDDSLREAECRRTVLHLRPSRAMLADALAQVLVRKGWTSWLLVSGPEADDRAYAAAIRRAALRFGAKVVGERAWTFTRDARRTAEGEATALTQGAPSADVVIVADEAGSFGDTLMFNTWEPRPVAGTQGLVAASFSPVLDQWGATQLLKRFRARTGREMGEKDFAAWQAGRAIGEAAMRARSTDPAVIEAAMRSPDFALAVFKGRAASFRPWDGQLRQPIVVGWARAVVAMAPQEGFLHPRTDLDTLGTDLGEKKCVFRP
jgi:ABC transporter substrate binding protein (PQQ-dependent alcohol dehydrogenase system)